MDALQRHPPAEELMPGFASNSFYCGFSNFRIGTKFLIRDLGPVLLLKRMLRQVLLLAWVSQLCIGPALGIDRIPFYAKSRKMHHRAAGSPY